MTQPKRYVSSICCIAAEILVIISNTPTISYEQKQPLGIDEGKSNHLSQLRSSPNENETFQNIRQLPGANVDSLKPALVLLVLQDQLITSDHSFLPNHIEVIIMRHRLQFLILLTN